MTADDPRQSRRRRDQSASKLQELEPAAIAGWPLISEFQRTIGLELTSVLNLLAVGKLSASSDQATLHPAYGQPRRFGVVRISPEVWKDVDPASEHYFLLRFNEGRTRVDRRGPSGDDHFHLEGIRIDPASWDDLCAGRPAREYGPPPKPVIERPEPRPQDLITDEFLRYSILAARSFSRGGNEETCYGLILEALQLDDLDRSRFGKLYRETRSQRRDARAKERELAGLQPKRSHTKKRVIDPKA